MNRARRNTERDRVTEAKQEVSRGPNATGPDVRERLKAAHKMWQLRAPW